MNGLAGAATRRTYRRDQVQGQEPKGVGSGLDYALWAFEADPKVKAVTVDMEKWPGEVTVLIEGRGAKALAVLDAIEARRPTTTTVNVRYGK